MIGKAVETGFRESSGQYQIKFYPDMPTEEALAEAKKGIGSHCYKCAACETTWAISSTAFRIKKNGICEFCQRAIKDKTYHCVRRDPTVKEILDRSKSGIQLGQADTAVLLKFARDNYHE